MTNDKKDMSTGGVLLIVSLTMDWMDLRVSKRVANWFSLEGWPSWFILYSIIFLIFNYFL